MGVSKSNNYDAVIKVGLLLDAELNEARRQLDIINNEIIKYEKRTTNKTSYLYRRGLEKRLNERTKHLKRIFSIEDTMNKAQASKSLSRYKKDLKAETLAYEKETKNRAGIFNVFNKLRTKGSVEYINKFKSAFSTLTRYFAAYKIINTVATSINVLAKELLTVEQNLARVRAISDGTNESMSLLRDTVFDVSVKYGKSASEVSAFTIEMSKLGKKSDEIRNLADDAAQLASILGDDMSVSGKLLVTVMNQYNLAIGESSRVTNTLLDTISSSPADLQGLITALQYIGVTASNVGFTIEETGKMIGFLASNGIKMSKVGTGLRNVLSKVATMGYDVKEMMDSLAESGFSVSDAFKEFGKRGGNVALLLLQNWEQVKKMMAEEMPTAAARMLKSAQAMDNWMSKFGRWRGFMVALFSGNDTDKYSETEKLIKLTDELRERNITVEEFDKELRRLLNTGLSEKEITDALAKKFKLSKYYYEYYATSGIANTEGGAAKTESALYSLVKKTYAENITQTELDKVRKSVEQRVNELVAEFKTTRKRVKDISQAYMFLNDEYGEAQSLVYKSFLEKLNGNEKEAKRLTEQLFAKQQNRYNYIVNNLYTKNEALEYYKHSKEKVESLREVLAKGFISEEDFKKAKEQADDWLKLLCLMTNDAFEDCKKTGNKGTKYKGLLSELKESNNEFKKLLAELRKNNIERIKDLESINEVNINGRNKPFNFEQYLIDKGLNPETMKKSDKLKMISEYKNYVNEFLDNIDKVIDETVKKHKEAEDVDYDAKSALLKSVIEDQKGMLKQTEKGTSAYDTILSSITSKQVELTNLETTHIKNTASFDNAQRKRKESLKKLSDELGITITKLKELLELEGENEKVKKLFKNIERGLMTVKNIYSKFNDEMLKNTMNRLDAERESLDAHYTEERDILKAQLDNHLITEGQYAKRRKALEKQRINEMNAIKKAEFEAQRKNDIEKAIVMGIANAAAAFAREMAEKGLKGWATGLVAAGLVSAQATAEVAAIRSRKFYPVRYEKGGWIDGDLHKNGGVPFTIGGRQGFEAEGGEFIVNRIAAAKNSKLIEGINDGEDFTTQLISAFEKARIRAYFTDSDLEAAERNKEFKNNNVNYI